jgi:hypothetical protein
MSDTLGNEEVLVRILFTDRMTSSSGELENEAFPVDELIEKDGKSLSVDRLAFLLSHDCIKHKLITFENHSRGREKWGFALGLVGGIRSITSQDGARVFGVHPDPIENFPPAPWDRAHAKIVRADASFTKGFVRGYRDKLVEIFQAQVTRIF